MLSGLPSVGSSPVMSRRTCGSIVGIVRGVLVTVFSVSSALIGVMVSPCVVCCCLVESTSPLWSVFGGFLRRSVLAVFLATCASLAELVFFAEGAFSLHVMCYL